MNTMTQHESHALEIAIPAQNLLLVPLSQLRPLAAQPAQGEYHPGDGIGGEHPSGSACCKT